MKGLYVRCPDRKTIDMRYGTVVSEPYPVVETHHLRDYERAGEYYYASTQSRTCVVIRDREGNRLVRGVAVENLVLVAPKPALDLTMVGEEHF